MGLAVARHRATGPRRIGSLVINPGGPGDSGVQYLRDTLGSDQFPEGLNERFDIVSWDPRGSGASAPVRCTTTRQFEEADLDPTPDTPADVAAIDAKAHRDSDACLRKAGDIIPHVGTANTVRDLESLREALGDARLSFVGYSYGTVIGTVYAERYPTRIRAMVLDGVAAPGGDEVDLAHRQAQSFERNLDDFLADCARRPACRFGHGDPAGALRRLIAELETGRRLPASYTSTDDTGHRHVRHGDLGIGELYAGVLLPLYSRSSWAVLEQALAEATDERAPSGSRLLSIRDQSDGRRPDGTWDTSYDARGAIRCEDRGARATDVVGDRGRIAAWAAELPFFGGGFATGLPGCYLFPRPTEPLNPPADGSITRAPPIVIVSSTGDPATPYAQGGQLQRAIVGSVVLTWDAADHTAYGRHSPCLDPPITRYLTDLVVPRDGLRCVAPGSATDKGG